MASGRRAAASHQGQEDSARGCFCPCRPDSLSPNRPRLQQHTMAVGDRLVALDSAVCRLLTLSGGQSGFGYAGGRSRCHPFWQGGCPRGAATCIQEGNGHYACAIEGDRMLTDSAVCVPLSPLAPRPEFTKCYANADDPQDCVLQKADYVECLHHTKEVGAAQLAGIITACLLSVRLTRQAIAASSDQARPDHQVALPEVGAVSPSTAEARSSEWTFWICPKPAALPLRVRDWGRARSASPRCYADLRWDEPVDEIRYRRADTPCGPLSLSLSLLLPTGIESCTRRRHGLELDSAQEPGRSVI